MDVREKAANEKRLIDVNDIYSLFNQSGIARLHVSDIDTIPIVDSVKVVRCMECKNWHEETGFCEKHSYFVDRDGVCCSPADSPNWTMFDPDDFCSYGERKEGDD